MEEIHIVIRSRSGEIGQMLERGSVDIYCVQETTISYKITETNSSFRVKECTTGQV